MCGSAQGWEAKGGLSEEGKTRSEPQEVCVGGRGDGGRGPDKGTTASQRPGLGRPSSSGRSKR